ncbi:tetratricopeptide repeat protein [Muricauda ruestringensis]|uniref:tetratricopeptide repeat-containing sensor histidine kinase n=1 Tax=Flagellimonas ruestringensis TaxID=111501 RepID=UPI001CD2B387|nr:tetratricopeptide repeat-containing sensor histidine kinase [Allomuricauda ruestringensis]MCA0958302.1 tetratricopeptide repeat protein [Allomuricauda ruestringensis]
MKKSRFLFLFFLFGLSVLGLHTIYSQKSNDSLWYYNNIITKLEDSDKLNAAFLFFDREIQKQLSRGDTIPAVQNLRRVAIGQYELGFLYESEATAVQALKLLENLKSNPITKEARSGVLNHLGIVYRNIKSYDKSLSYYKEALKYAVDYSDSIPTINNISNVYLDQGKYKQALKNSKLVAEMRLKQNDSIGIARAFDNLGFVQSKLNIPNGLTNMRKALNIRLREHDVSGMYSSRHHLSEYFLNQGNRQKAVEHAEQAYDLAKQLNSASYIENALSLLLDLSDDPKIIEYRKLTDSLSLAKQIQENKYAVIKYNVEKERQNTQMAELQKEREKRYKIIFLSAFLLAVMGAMFILYRKNQQRKRELVQTVQKTEARISKRVHDDLANDVSGVMTFVENKLSTSTNFKENLLNYLNDIYLRARDISVANTGVDVSDFPAALKSLIAQYHPKGVNVITSPYSNINWDDVPEHKKIQLYKCLQELLVNSKKHSKATLISIAFNGKGKKNEIVYSDNGIGFDSDNIVLGGLNNVETRMTEIEGSFSFESNEGKGFIASLLF